MIAAPHCQQVALMDNPFCQPGRRRNSCPSQGCGGDVVVCQQAVTSFHFSSQLTSLLAERVTYPSKPIET